VCGPATSPRLGDHAAIADQHDALQRKPLLEFFDLIGERCRISSFRSLLGDLATVTRNIMAMDGAPEASFVLYPQLTPVQDRAWAHVRAKIIMRTAFVAAIISALLIPSITLAWGEYSQGSRVGIITKFSEKGFLFKTWEGQLNLGGITTSTDNNGNNSVVSHLQNCSGAMNFPPG
jgi:hypothetical protein